MAKYKGEDRNEDRDTVMMSIADTEFNHLFRCDSGAPCPQGFGLLRAFAEARPSDFSFLQANDLSDHTNSAFAGIEEWDAFAQHYASCKRCNV